jgi:hypothetical protein
VGEEAGWAYAANAFCLYQRPVSNNITPNQIKTTMIYFTDFFQVTENDIEKYGAFNISLINDLPLFIDPFLIFGNKKSEYQRLHTDILKYLKFIKDKVENSSPSLSQLKAWYTFHEVKQNWLGYSTLGNAGSGLGLDFAKSFSSNLKIVFDDLGDERITMSSHLEKAGLFEIGVGTDNISDFTCNLIKEYLLDYTQNFAQAHISNSYLKQFKVEKVYFDYELERWMPKEFTLPFYNDNYVLLTPKDILTKDDTWINSSDLRRNFEEICISLENDQLRFEISNYFRKMLPALKENEKHTQKDLTKATIDTIRQFPIIVKYYIKSKEENKEGAKNVSQQNVEEVQSVFILNVQHFVNLLQNNTEFYNFSATGSYTEAYKRIEYLKKVIEENDGYRLFYYKDEPIKKEEYLQIIYRLTWYATTYDVNREVNNGRGPVDYSISKGSKDKTLVEFKLASNAKLKQNLAHQVEIYEKASSTDSSIKVILYFNDTELVKVNKILKELKLDQNKNIILIDAGKKISASNVK